VGWSTNHVLTTFTAYHLIHIYSILFKYEPFLQNQNKKSTRLFTNAES